MVKVALLDRRQELEKKIERLRLEEQLAVAQVRERVYTEIESGVKEVLSPPPKLPSEAFLVGTSPFLDPSFHTVSSAFITPSVKSAMMANVSDSACFHDAPATQMPPKLMQRPFATENHVPDIQQSSTPMSRRKSNRSHRKISSLTSSNGQRPCHVDNRTLSQLKITPPPISNVQGLFNFRDQTLLWPSPVSTTCIKVRSNSVAFFKNRTS